MDPVDNYRKSASAYSSAKATLESMAERFDKLSRGLRSPDRTYIANGRAIFPYALTDRGDSLDASQLPTIDEVAEALSRYHQTRESVTSTWDRVPQHERASLKSPEELEQVASGLGGVAAPLFGDSRDRRGRR